MFSCLRSLEEYVLQLFLSRTEGRGNTSYNHSFFFFFRHRPLFNWYINPHHRNFVNMSSEALGPMFPTGSLRYLRPIPAGSPHFISRRCNLRQRHFLALLYTSLLPSIGGGSAMADIKMSQHQVMLLRKMTNSKEPCHRKQGYFA